jgi:hypothetical protein
VHKALTASVADASICSRRAVSNGSSVRTAVLHSRRPIFFEMLHGIRPTYPPGRPRDRFRVHPKRPDQRQARPVGLRCSLVARLLLRPSATGPWSTLRAVWCPGAGHDPAVAFAGSVQLYQRALLFFLPPAFFCFFVALLTTRRLGSKPQAPGAARPRPTGTGLTILSRGRERRANARRDPPSTCKACRPSNNLP